MTIPLSQGYLSAAGCKYRGNNDANYSQNLIGVLRWAIELGRIDIHIFVAYMLRYLASPRRGHLKQVYHIFAYLKHYERSKMVYDPKMCN